MSQDNASKRKLTTAATMLLAVLASVALAACGGSSGTSTTTATSAAASSPSTTSGSSTTSTAPKTTPPRGAFGARFTAVRKCLRKDGIVLPKRTAGQRPGGGLLGGGAGSQLPKGVTRAQYEAAVKKCGGSSTRGGFGAGGTRFNSPAVRQALVKFAECMRTNGVNVPAPNTSGKGSIFSTKGINTRSTKFLTAETKCRSDLLGGLRARPGAGAPGASPAPTG